MASPNVLELTTGNFDQEVKSGTVVVADFWAPWCGPCRQLSPVIDRIADQFAGKVKVGKLNVDENPNIAVKYDVMTIRKGTDARYRIAYREAGKGTFTDLIDAFTNEYSLIDNDGPVFFWPVYVTLSGVGNFAGRVGCPAIAAGARSHSFSAPPSSAFFSDPQPVPSRRTKNVRTPAPFDTVTSPG